MFIAWAVVNKLTLNFQKTKEIVFRHPRVSDVIESADEDLFHKM